MKIIMQKKSGGKEHSKNMFKYLQFHNKYLIL